MSGVALYGDLQAALESQEPFTLDHRLEAVTMLAPDGAQHEPTLYGAITAECIARAESAAGFDDIATSHTGYDSRSNAH